MKFFGKELKYNGNDIWHKDNFTPSKVAISNSYTDLNNRPTKLSQFANDLSMGLIQIIGPTTPTNLKNGQVWIQTY